MNARRNHTRRPTRALLRYALPLAVGLGLTGCDDFLTTEPKGQLTNANFFTTEAHALQATTATYAMLRNWTVHVFFWIGMTDIVSDDATKGSTPTDAGYQVEMEDLTFSEGTLNFGGTWEGYFDGIYRANVAIENIPNVPMNEERRARLVGENKFLRAYYYFFLVRSYGGVPLITEVLRPGEYQHPRASVEEVYAQIEQDLTEAIAVLPDSYGSTDAGRVTRGAARALLAQAHLFQGEYQAAFDEAQAVINSGQYSLYPDYHQLFRPQGENSSESVFEVQAVAMEGGNNGASGGAVQYPVVQGVRGTPNMGWGFNTPSPNLEASYEPGDPRLQATIMYPWEMMPDGSGTIVYLNPTMLNNRYNQKVQQSTTNPGGPDNSGVNIRRIRYADVLLMGAEAAFRIGNEGQARTWLNMVRARARQGQTVTLGIQPETLSGTILSDALGVDTDSRVVVRFVGEGTDAFAAGLRGFSSQRDDAVTPVPVGVTNLDVITAVDGTPITDMASYLAAVSGTSEGEVVSVDILRVTQAGATPMSVDVQVSALLPDVTVGGEALLQAIWQERRHELAMEQHRWFDIVRQGRAAQVMSALTCADRALPAGCAAISFQTGKHELFPLPGAEVTIAGLTQNPGY